MMERPPVLAPNGAVATAHPLATAAALEMLRRGGSAADAIVAAGSVLLVVEPWASHLGGDAFAIVFDAASGRVRALQGSGIAPRDLDAGAMLGREIPPRGALSITVPGVVSAWFRLLRGWGRLDAAEVFAPAIEIARGGFPVHDRWARMARLHRALLAEDPGLAALFLPRGEPRGAGTWVRQPDLADTLGAIARDGEDLFYRGPLAARIVDEIRSRGGALSSDDLSGHRTEEVDPLSIDLDGAIVCEQPPVSQGAMVLAILRVLKETDRLGWRLSDDGPRAIAREIHLQVEAYRLIRVERDAWLCDPRSAPAQVEEGIARWLSRDHAANLAARIDPERTAAAREDTRAAGAETTYLCAVDGAGNAVSWIQSIFHAFGAGWIVPGTGILLNCRMAGFSSDPASPNRLEAGKRPVHTLNPWMVLRGGRPWLLGGTPGAEAQIQVNVQLLRARVVRGLPLAEAIRSPRWSIDERDRLCLEARIPREVRRRLEHRGHRAIRLGPWEGPGLAQAIERLDEGGWLACTDPRGEGLAAGR